MSKVAILTDTNSGITPAEAERLGVFVIPMPFYINDQLFFEYVDLSQDSFYEMLGNDCTITTSMPSVGDVMDKWDELLEEYDEVVYIPMSSGLSSSCQTAIMVAEDDYEDKVFVVDNQRISVTMRLSALEAKKLADEGKNGAEIKAYLEEHKSESTIYITVDTLQYLKKGGRLTPAVAAIGTLLHIKPVLQIQGEKLDSFAKARTMKQAKSMMLDAIEKDLNERFKDPSGKDYVISISHSHNLEEAEIFKAEAEERFPNHKILINPLALSVSCHIGPGALAITASKSIVENI